MNKKLNAIWYAEEGELFPDSDALARKQHGNPYIEEMTRLAPEEHHIEAFEAAVEWARENKRGLKTIKEDINEKQIIR